MTNKKYLLYFCKFVHIKICTSQHCCFEICLRFFMRHQISRELENIGGYILSLNFSEYKFSDIVQQTGTFSNIITCSSEQLVHLCQVTHLYVGNCTCTLELHLPIMVMHTWSLCEHPPTRTHVGAHTHKEKRTACSCTICGNEGDSQLTCFYHFYTYYEVLPEAATVWSASPFLDWILKNASDDEQQYIPI